MRVPPRSARAVKALVLVLALAILFESATAASTKPASTTKTSRKKNKNSSNKNNKSNSKKKTSSSSRTTRSSTTAASVSRTAPKCVESDANSLAFCAQEANNDPLSVFKCGNTQVGRTWALLTPPCRDGSVACRLEPGAPPCIDGVPISYVVGADGEVTIDGAASTGQILVKGGTGYCVYAANYAGTLRAPNNCGVGTKTPNQCGVSHVDFCACKPTSVSFYLTADKDGNIAENAQAVTSLSDIDKPVCEKTSDYLVAVDSCGVRVKITATTDGVAAAPRSIVDITATPSTCGTFFKTYAPAYLGSTLAHTVKLHDDLVDITEDDEHPMCSQHFECDDEQLFVPDVSFDKDTCKVTGTFLTALSNKCGVSIKPDPVVIDLDDCYKAE